jgi:hypothetical protein
MNRSILIISIMLLVTLFVFSPARADLMIIHDQTFLNSNWDVIKGNGTNFASVAVSRIVNGGVTGDAQVTSAFRTFGASSFTYEVEHYKTDASFAPSSQGTITSIDWQLWYKFQGTSTYGALRLLARQGNGFYIANATYTEPQNASPFWQKASGTITPNAFSLFRGTGAGTLDFGSGAAPIQFGYMNSSSVFLPVPRVDYSASFFDLQITSTAVPEPSCALLMLVGLLLILSFRRRWRL